MSADQLKPPNQDIYQEYNALLSDEEALMRSQKEFRLRQEQVVRAQRVAWGRAFLGEYANMHRGTVSGELARLYRIRAKSIIDDSLGEHVAMAAMLDQWSCHHQQGGFFYQPQDPLCAIYEVNLYKFSARFIPQHKLHRTPIEDMGYSARLHLAYHSPTMTTREPKDIKVDFVRPAGLEIVIDQNGTSIITTSPSYHYTRKDNGKLSSILCPDVVVIDQPLTSSFNVPWKFNIGEDDDGRPTMREVETRLFSELVAEIQKAWGLSLGTE